MDIKARLENDLKDALRSGDEIRKNTIRMTLSAIKLSQVEKGVMPDETGLIAIVQKEIKSRKESISDAEKANRNDMITTLHEEIKVLEGYLPEQLGQAELHRLVKKAIEETGATAITDMGKVMKVVLPMVQGRAPNDQVSATVRAILQQNV